MNLVVMQPYLFPYIGYFHLLQAADVFVFYDDVNFIKGGWIHRNKILVANTEMLFSVPIKKASSFVPINQTMINEDLYDSWRQKFLKTLEQAYAKAPFFDSVFELIKAILTPKKISSIGALASTSIIEVSNFLGLDIKWMHSSEQFTKNTEIDRTQRLINIATSVQASRYINSPGGRALYSADDFMKHNIELKFIESKAVVYKQFGEEFVPNLSIIDVLMFNSKQATRLILEKYQLVD